MQVCWCSHLLHLTPSFASSQAKPKQHSTHSVAEQVLQQLLQSMAANNDTPGAEAHLHLSSA